MVIDVVPATIAASPGGSAYHIDSSVAYPCIALSFDLPGCELNERDAKTPSSHRSTGITGRPNAVCPSPLCELDDPQLLSQNDKDCTCMWSSYLDSTSGH